MYKIPDYELLVLEENRILLLNLVNGCADELDFDTAKKFEENRIDNLSQNIIDNLIEREYLFLSESDYLNFIDSRDDYLLEQSRLEVPNFIYIPTYQCNLNCYYCFEKSYEKSDLINEIPINALNIFKKFCNSKISELELKNNVHYNKSNILITLTGGEPLLVKNYNEIEELCKWSYENGFSLSIVTNGTTLHKFIDILKKYPVSHLQVTLDGDKEIHDKIRVGHNEEPSFNLIVENLLMIENIVKNIIVRININKKNIDSIINLKSLVKKFKNIKFYTYLMQQEGCSDENNILNEVDGLKRLFQLKKSDNCFENLVIEYHGRNFIESVVGVQDFNPIVKVCSAMQNQYIVDFRGDIYKCWWGMGSADYSIGNINDNNYNIDSIRSSLYTDRFITKMSNCKKCKYRYLCGGGCSGRLTNEQLIKKDVICPNFKGIFEYIFSEIIKN